MADSSGSLDEKLNQVLSLLARAAVDRCAVRGDIMQQLYRAESKLAELEMRLGGKPKPGVGFATLDSLDEKISTLFLTLERMGAPQSWVTKQRQCEAYYGPNKRPGLTQCEHGAGHIGPHANAVLGAWSGTGRDAR